MKVHQTVTLTEDSTGPALQGITFDKNSKGEVTKLYFEFDEVLGAVSDSFDVTVKNLRTNETVLVEDLLTVADVDGIKLASDNKTVVVTLDTEPGNPVVTGGNYEFTVVPGFVNDDAAGANSNKKVSKAVDFGKVANVVKVSTHIVSDTDFEGNKVVDGVVVNKVLVGFDQLVTTESAKNPANYLFGGKALPAGTEIIVHEGIPLIEQGMIFAQVVEFDLPEGYVSETDGVKVEVKNIKPLDSYCRI